MPRALALFVLATTLAACGVETATTAATVAEMKRREVEQAKNDLDRVKQKIEQNTQQIMQGAQQTEENSKE